MDKFAVKIKIASRTILFQLIKFIVAKTKKIYSYTEKKISPGFYSTLKFFFARLIKCLK